MSTASGFSDAILQIPSSTGSALVITTIWLPIPTAYPSRAGCTTEIYQPAAGDIFAWDPLYGATISPAATPCLPREVSASYSQSLLKQVSVTTLLGPTFVCPVAYSQVLALVIDSHTRQTLCCPTSFTLNVALTTGGYPQQCVSDITAGEVLTFMTATGGASQGEWRTTTTTLPTPTTMLAMYVNGYNIVSSSDTSGSTSSSASISPASSTISSVSTIVSTSTATLTGSANTSLSSGVSAGIGVAATLALILAALGGFLLFRRIRKRKAGFRAPTEDGRKEYGENGNANGSGSALSVEGDQFDSWVEPVPVPVPVPMPASQEVKDDETPAPMKEIMLEPNVKFLRHEVNVAAR